MEPQTPNPLKSSSALKNVPVGNKSIRTPQQLDMLAQARIKALQVRQFNASVKKAEKDTANLEKTNLKKIVLQKYQKLVEPQAQAAIVPEPEPIVVEPEPEPITEVSDEREVILIKKKPKPRFGIFY